mgnify:CR=1 FL=1
MCIFTSIIVNDFSGRAALQLPEANGYIKLIIRVTRINFTQKETRATYLDFLLNQIIMSTIRIVRTNGGCL